MEIACTSKTNNREIVRYSRFYPERRLTVADIADFGRYWPVFELVFLRIVASLLEFSVEIVFFFLALSIDAFYLCGHQEQCTMFFVFKL